MHSNLKRFGVAAGLMAALPILINALTVTGYGPWRSFGIETLVLALLMLLAIISLPLALIVAVALRDSAGARQVVAISSGILLGGVFGNWAGDKLRLYAFELAAERAVPLLSAIESYEQQYGHPPEQLSLLVPKFLDALPERLPPLKINVGTEASSRYHADTWVLTADVPRALLNWDLFIYLPDQNYTDVGAAGVSPVGNWAYLHE